MVGGTLTWYRAKNSANVISGSTAAYCSTGCQSSFGNCDTPPQASPKPKKISPDGTCGPSGYTCVGSKYGDCCSQYNYCGASSSYCSTGCQSAFGTCNKVSSSSIRPSTLVTSTSSRTGAIPSSLPLSTDSRCGPAFGGQTCKGSRYGDCCSQYFYWSVYFPSIECLQHVTDSL
jgi:hypothetical protein